MKKQTAAVRIAAVVLSMLSFSHAQNSGQTGACASKSGTTATGTSTTTASHIPQPQQTGTPAIDGTTNPTDLVTGSALRVLGVPQLASVTSVRTGSSGINPAKTRATIVPFR